MRIIFTALHNMSGFHSRQRSPPVIYHIAFIFLTEYQYLAISLTFSDPVCLKMKMVLLIFHGICIMFWKFLFACKVSNKGCRRSQMNIRKRYSK